MGDIYSIRNIDLEFGFATTELAAGSSIRTGGGTHIDDAYLLDRDSVLEVCGAQLIGPATKDGARQKIEHVKLILNGDDYKHVVVNEVMAPPFTAFAPNTPFNDGGLCYNIGKPMLGGGNPLEATAKVGPGQTLGVEVKAPVATDGGAAITEDMVVRLTVAEVKGEDTLGRVLSYYDAMSPGGDIEQGFTLMDLEQDRSLTVDKSVPATLKDWTKLHGGLDAEKSRIMPFVKYAQNSTATTVNEAFGMYDVGTRVNKDFMDFFWNYDETEATMLTHMGVLRCDNLESVRVYKHGRSTNPYMNARVDENENPMPMLERTDAVVYNGPAKLMKPVLVWDEKAQVEILDDGTSIPAWSSGVSSAMVALWGKSYEME